MIVNKTLVFLRKSLLFIRYIFNYKNYKKTNKNIKFNFNVFVKKEKKEVDELIRGKQSFRKYCQDSFNLFKDYFIPNDSNDNRPKILRPKQLLITAILLVLLKFSLVGYIFFVYQEKAEMSTDINSQIIALVNEDRLANNLPALNLNQVLNLSAQAKADDMIANNYFSHTSPDGRKPWNFIDRGDYPYALIGENLAINFIDAGGVHSALMASPSHRSNILNPKYTDIGLAIVRGQIFQKETNILVQFFGSRTDKLAAISIDAPAMSSTSVSSTPVSSTLETKLIKSDGQPSSVVEVKSESIDIGAKELPDSGDVSVDSGNEVPIDPNPSGVSDISEPVKVALLATSSQSEAVINLADDSSMPISELGVENAMLESENLPEEPKIITPVNDQKTDRVVEMIKISKIIYLVFLVILIVAFLINIFVRITVQHKTVIIQSLLLIILVAALLLFDFGFIKDFREAAVKVIVL